MSLTTEEKSMIRLMLLQNIKSAKLRKRLIQVASALAADEKDAASADEVYCSVLYTFMQPERAKQFETVYEKLREQGAFSDG